jgi:hypothetical protein
MLLTAIVYLPALDAGFVFDDRINIEQASGVHWTEVSPGVIGGLLDSTLIPRRVVANASFALNHLAGGLAPRGYHLVNVLIHLAVGLTLAWAAFLYLRMVFPARERQQLGMAAVVPVVLFLVHPLNTQAVTYVVQRMTSLAALFSLLALARGSWPSAAKRTQCSCHSSSSPSSGASTAPSGVRGGEVWPAGIVGQWVWVRVC